MLSVDPTIPQEGVIRLLDDPTSPTSQSLLALHRAYQASSGPYQALRGPYQPSRVQVTL